MKSILFLSVSLISISSFAADDVVLGLRPTIGLGATPKGTFGVAKTYILDLGNKGDPLHADFLGAGLGVGSIRGFVFAPINIKYKHIGVGTDYNPKNGDMGFSVSYSF